MSPSPLGSDSSALPISVAGTMNLHAAEVDRLRLHRHSRLAAGDEQIARLDRAVARIDMNFHAACRRDHRFRFARFAEDHARLFGDAPATLVAYAVADGMTVFFAPRCTTTTVPGDIFVVAGTHSATSW